MGADVNFSPDSFARTNFERKTSLRKILNLNPSGVFDDAVCFYIDITDDSSTAADGSVIPE